MQSGQLDSETNGVLQSTHRVFRLCWLSPLWPLPLVHQTLLVCEGREGFHQSEHMWFIPNPEVSVYVNDYLS